ncbi:Berberine bridge enzyme-like 14 [Linum perenne]
MRENENLILFQALLVLLALLISAANSTPISDFVKCISADKFSPSSLTPTAPPIKTGDSLYLPDNPQFITVLNAYIRNLCFELPTTPKPLAIVTAKHEAHVRSVILCAKTTKLQVRIRSGGHDYEGLSYWSAINISLPEQTAWVESGAVLGELYYAIAKKSNVHAFPAGACPSLGAGGHFSGGGYGNMIRKFGLSVDNIIDAKIVDVKGNLLDRKSMGDDLFWAIKGGGGASFGVIIAWKIKLVKVPERVTVFKVERTLEEGLTSLIVKYQDMAPKVEPELFLRAPPPAPAPANSTVTVRGKFMAQYLGEPAKLVSLMNEKFPELGIKLTDCIPMRWVDTTLYWYGKPNDTKIEFLIQRETKYQSYLKRKSDYTKKPVPKEGLEAVWKKMVEVGDVGMTWNPYGGIMDEIPEDATPFPHRKGNLFKIQYSAQWKEEGNDSIELHVERTKQLYEAMTPYVSKDPREAFLNYRDLELGSIGSNGNGTFQQAADYGLPYYKKNFDRLIKVKAAVDPDNFFKFEQSIPVTSKRSEL